MNSKTLYSLHRSISSSTALWIFVVLTSGCASGTERMTNSVRDGGVSLYADGAVVLPPCEQVNATAVCFCGGVRGRRVCQSNGWSDCQCSAVPSSLPDGSVGGSSRVPAGNLRSDIQFDWERSGTNIGASCEPGHYEGDFQGLYASQLTFVCAPIPVFALGTPLQPGLSFNLEQSANGEYLEIRDGVMIGTADGFFPFRGTITGTLDCDTLKFEATLEGYYSLGVDGIGMFRFVGPLLADYDPVTHSMINATWDVDEYDFATGEPRPDHCGGLGVWTAEWVP